MTPKYRHSASWNLSWGFVLIAIICVYFADLAISTQQPWEELSRFFSGLIPPSFDRIDEPFDALLQTLAFAILGVALGSVSGFVLSLMFHWSLIRLLCAFVRAIHELFWALIFLQIFGLHPLTGLLAIAIPYAGTFAKIYAEILEEGDRSAFDAISKKSGHISAFFYTRLPDLWYHFKTYTSYRLECALRSSTVLGFVGLPTLGYSLSTSFMEGQYPQVWALLIIFYLIIATIRFWVRPVLIPFYIVIAPFIIKNDTEISFDNVQRFFTQDIIPSPILNNESWGSIWHWFTDLWLTQAWPGIINTLVLTQIALIVTAVFALLMFPLISKHLASRLKRNLGGWILIILRSTPEYILAFILLLLWGPSMLPAVIALALHNGAIIAHLIGHYSNSIPLRQDSQNGAINTYSYELVPKVYGQFLAFIFYRWEIILRETAILGILGIATLGFYIDNAIQDIRLDRAMVLILITALLNIAIDKFSRTIRKRLKISTMVECR